MANSVRPLVASSTGNVQAHSKLRSEAFCWQLARCFGVRRLNGCTKTLFASRVQVTEVQAKPTLPCCAELSCDPPESCAHARLNQCKANLLSDMRKEKGSVL